MMNLSKKSWIFRAQQSCSKPHLPSNCWIRACALLEMRIGGSLYWLRLVAIYPVARGLTTKPRSLAESCRRDIGSWTLPRLLWTPQNWVPEGKRVFESKPPWWWHTNYLSADPSSLWGGARLGSCCRRLWSNGGGLDERDSSTNLAVSHDLSTGGLQASKSYVAQRFALLEATFFFVFSRFQKQRFGIFLFSAFFVGSKSNVSAVFWLRFRMVWAYIPFFLMGSDSDVSAFFRLRFRNGLGTKPDGVLPFRMRVPNTFFLSLAWWLAGFFFVFSRVQKQRFGSFLAAVSHGLGPISFSF